MRSGEPGRLAVETATTCTTLCRFAAPPAPAAAAAPSAEAAAAAALATAAARAGRLRDLDLDLTTIELGAVEARDGRVRVFAGRHLDEPEAARPPGVAIHHDGRRLDLAEAGEGFA